MKLYLSSYRMGDKVDKLKELIGDENKAAFIPNACDGMDPEEVKHLIDRDLEDLRQAGLEPTVLDLKDYFGKCDALKHELHKYFVIWVRGGNTFVLRQAMKLSGMDTILESMWVARVNKVYGGYSAGVCVLSHSLKGIRLADDPNVKPYGEEHETIWEGLEILPYYIVPHYRSDHFESPLAEKVVQYYIDHKMLFKALHDGEVVIIK
ncbi:Type 1 glutamine amidotransferase-like domain-containing protein [Polluticoccus soli]|uniref:Type 1 glutamine amidotransferase-like domain-containing protein n=1 Tax=Polluticoccus soli TaxID=3034150 RepID=UPI0023E10AE9|nr:Type 1 glutamine amidotransferase-like domain-containing protein [Flavipsychrobacter sp. JY13-12]